MTMTQAVEMLWEMIPDEDAVKIDDGAQMWDVSALVDAIREQDDGNLHNLAVNYEGISRVRPDGTIESIHVYQVRPRPYIWEIRKNGREIIATEEQSGVDMKINGRNYMLDAIIPIDHADAAQDGEWDEEGFTYLVGEDYYVVTYRNKPR